MNELIQVAERQIGDGTIQTVNARDLHAFLGVGKMFAAWINDRIQKYGFVENQDFVCFPILESKNLDGRGGHNRKDYHLSLDMAKELAMVERNDKGKQARLYFIECQRRAKANVIDITTTLADPANLTMSSREIANLTNKRHADVMRDIRNMLGQLDLSSSDFATQYRNEQNGQSYPIFNLPLIVALTYLAQVSKELGVKIMGEALKSSSVATEVLKALQDFEVPDDLPGMYVYAIRNTVTGNVKLGISRNPEARLKQLQTGNDCRLELVAMRPAAARFADEKALHNANAPLLQSSASRNQGYQRINLILEKKNANHNQHSKHCRRSYPNS